LNQNLFNFTSFSASNGSPDQIQMQVKVLGTSLKVTLNKIEGLIYNSSIYSQVKFTSNPNITGHNLVI
jgi:hypothetical protein